MNERIKALCDLTLKGEMYVKQVKTEFDRMDLFLSECERDVKRLCEYMMNQEPIITEYQTMTGFFNFSSDVVGDLFHRRGHKYTDMLLGNFYLRNVDGLHVVEWQHATADYEEVLDIGLVGILDKIERFLVVHSEGEKREYLLGDRTSVV